MVLFHYTGHAGDKNTLGQDLDPDQVEASQQIDEETDDED